MDHQAPYSSAARGGHAEAAYALVRPAIERRVTGQRIWKVVRAAGKRTGIPALHPHALRHACGAQLLRRTRNLRLVQEQLRHADVQTTTGYTKITQQDIREGLETLDEEGE